MQTLLRTKVHLLLLLKTIPVHYIHDDSQWDQRYLSRKAFKSVTFFSAFTNKRSNISLDYVLCTLLLLCKYQGPDFMIQNSSAEAALVLGTPTIQPYLLCMIPPSCAGMESTQLQSELINWKITQEFHWSQISSLWGPQYSCTGTCASTATACKSTFLLNASYQSAKESSCLHFWKTSKLFCICPCTSQRLHL